MSMSSHRGIRTTILCLLYFAQGFPYGFVLYTLFSVFVDQGFTREQAGIITGFSVLPWTFKFAWAPLIDSVRFPAMGLRRPWILIAQLGMALTLIANSWAGDMGNLAPGATIELSSWAAGLFSWVPGATEQSSPNEVSTLVFIAGVFFLHNAFASLQDVATDALAVDILEESERGRVNGFMWGSKLFGITVGTTGGAYLIEHFQLNFTLQFLAIGILLIAGVVLAVRERDGEKRLPWTSGKAVSFQNHALRSPLEVLLQLFRALSQWTTGAAVLLSVITSISLGIFIPLASDTFINVYDWESLDYSKALGTWGIGGELCGALLGGFLCDRLGRRRIAAVGGIGMGCAMIAFSLLLTEASINPTWLLPIFKGFVAFQTVALFSLYMKICWTTSAATQFTLYMSVSNLGTYIGNEIARIDGMERGTLFMIAGIAAFVPLLVLFTLRPDAIVDLRKKMEAAK
ncbi:hypothetical protein CBD41_07485 [bacterium TMED181]|nr:hypothetical protein [Planctomycetota bacterium]OUW43201.1 MAG: hypothetical protein CBD41_07485 [bacterium TMED181]